MGPEIKRRLDELSVDELLGISCESCKGEYAKNHHTLQCGVALQLRDMGFSMYKFVATDYTPDGLVGREIKGYCDYHKRNLERKDPSVGNVEVTLTKEDHSGHLGMSSIQHKLPPYEDLKAVYDEVEARLADGESPHEIEARMAEGQTAHECNRAPIVTGVVRDEKDYSGAITGVLDGVDASKVPDGISIEAAQVLGYPTEDSKKREKLQKIKGPD